MSTHVLFGKNGSDKNMSSFPPPLNPNIGRRLRNVLQLPKAQKRAFVFDIIEAFFN